jgi:hypothetical protein
MKKPVSPVAPSLAARASRWESIRLVAGSCLCRVTVLPFTGDERLDDARVLVGYRDTSLRRPEPLLIVDIPKACLVCLGLGSKDD